MALMVWANYKWGIEPKLIYQLPTRTARFAAFYALYLLAFGIPYLIYFAINREVQYPATLKLLVLLAPALFAFKVTAGGWKEVLLAWVPEKPGRFWGLVIDWPLRLLITSLLLYVVMTALPEKRSFIGWNTKGFQWGPYLLLLACMVPLVAMVAGKPDFLATYPKLKALNFLAPDGPAWWQMLLYELGYGSDFITIEIFFRGFLVILFARYVGPAAVIPMAVFYCSIHFGKPLLECISSYFGGMILGIIACSSQSVIGGLVVHLGLAWMMELAAGIALHLKK